ncbi:PQQ-like beta-propeller repeat protein [Myxococcota bacterium]|nr:PQQ-like beta-propeller repeat protein [Myxococcota bacterium]
MVLLALDKDKAVRDAAFAAVQKVGDPAYRALLERYDMVLGVLGSNNPFRRLLADNKSRLGAPAHGVTAKVFRLQRKHFPGSPVLHHGVLYVQARQMVYAFLPRDSTLLWKHRGAWSYGNYPLRLTQSGIMLHEDRHEEKTFGVRIDSFFGTVRERTLEGRAPITGQRLSGGEILVRKTDGFSVVQRGRILYSSSGRFLAEGKTGLFALSRGTLTLLGRRSGRVIWQYGSGLATSCSILEGEALVYFAHKVTLLAADGKVKWSLDMANASGGLIHGPYICLFGDGPEKIACVGRETGKVAWDRVHTTRTMMTWRNMLLLIKDQVTALDVHGKKLWSHPLHNARVRADVRGLYIYGKEAVTLISPAGKRIWHHSLPGFGLRSLRFERDFVYLIGKRKLGALRVVDGGLLGEYIWPEKTPLYCGTSYRGMIVCAAYRHILVVTLFSMAAQNYRDLFTVGK